MILFSDLHGNVLDYEKCIYIFPDTAEKVSWVRANELCSTKIQQENGKGTLITIHDEHLPKAVAEIVDQESRTETEYWIGLRNVCQKCTYFWIRVRK